MNGVDETITGALQDRADGGVHVEELLVGARRQGQRRQTVRRVFTGAGAGVTALAVIGAAAVLLPGEAPGPEITAAGPPPVSPPGRPPVAVGAPVLGQGGTPGRNGLFHLDHNGRSATTASWRSGPGWELMEAGSQAAGVYTVALGDSPTNVNKALTETGVELTDNPTTTKLTVDGKPATLVWSGMEPADGARWGYIRWQPVAGTTALVLSSFAADPGTNGATDRARLLAFTEEVRFDRVYRCAVNFRTTWLPPNAAVTSCGFFGGDRPTARVQFSAGAATFSVSIEPQTEKQVKPNADHAGTPMEYTDAGRVRRAVGNGAVTVEPLAGKLDREDALRLAAGVRPITTADPSGWPAGPAG